MKKTKYLFVCLVLAVSYLCLAVEPPGAKTETVSFVAAKSELPTNNGIGSSEGVALFVVAASVIALVSRRTSLAIKTNFRVARKSFVAVANRGVQKLNVNQRRSVQRDCDFTETNLSATT